MKLIKRLHLFILQTFLPLFAMTFFIVLFIVLMQFLWKYIDDLVGKGVAFDVLAELFFYAAVSMVPMALPLAILLASLMTFGNLGERLELTAIKASGISLIRTMAPLIVLVSGIAVGAFFFQNDILPKAQVKMWTLLFSMRQKSPELEIPEGVFYDQIPGFNLYVKEKNQQTGMLYDIMIYDVSKGGDNATIILADSARLAMTSKMSHLYLHLFEGEQFENLRDQNIGGGFVPFRRESFFDKQVLIPFDANFNRLDEEGMRKQYVGKNITQLNQTIDSVSVRLDSIGNNYSRQLQTSTISYPLFTTDDGTPSVSTEKQTENPDKQPALSIAERLDKLPPAKASQIIDKALELSMRTQQEFQFRSQEISDEKKTIRRHEIELIKKFTLSVACIVFFFIGAPLGAIIRKGGIGTPLVISVLFFLVYYIIDNTGYKMARDGRWPVALGMWLSTAILLPIGAYVTWKAMNDSSVFDKDRYVKYLRKILGLKEKRRVDFKEVIIHDLDIPHALENLSSISEESAILIRQIETSRGFLTFWTNGIDRRRLQNLIELTDKTIEQLTDCRDNRIVAKLKDFPVMRNLLIYSPLKVRNKTLAWMIAIIGFPVRLIALRYLRNLRSELNLEETFANNISDSIAATDC
ncbi:MAG: LptF/LptG family permease [Muribaculaceae bacterium]|nr:LptF/LptG family permease [Muribaculaceae bacterium]